MCERLRNITWNDGSGIEDLYEFGVSPLLILAELIEDRISRARVDDETFNLVHLMLEQTRCLDSCVKRLIEERAIRA